MRDLLAPRVAPLFVAALASSLLGACRDAAPVDGAAPCAQLAAPELELPELERDDRISRRNLRRWVELLASPRLAGRHAGDPGARQAAALVAAQMAALGLAAPWPAGYCQGFRLLDAEDFNVVGHLTSGAAADPRPAILLGAHYDGQGTHPAGAIYPGADDNASGIAALLEVARLARRRAAGSGVDWVFAALGGEEVGQQGAATYLAAPSLDLARVELMVNLDMVGRPLPAATPEAIGFLAAGGSREATAALLRRAAALAGVEVVDLQGFGDSRPEISDAAAFAPRLPALLLSTALHEDHHGLGDTPDRVDDAQIERTANVVLTLADILTGRP